MHTSSGSSLSSENRGDWTRTSDPAQKPATTSEHSDASTDPVVSPVVLDSGIDAQTRAALTRLLDLPPALRADLLNLLAAWDVLPPAARAAVLSIVRTKGSLP